MDDQHTWPLTIIVKVLSVPALHQHQLQVLKMIVDQIPDLEGTTTLSSDSGYTDISRIAGIFLLVLAFLRDGFTFCAQICIYTVCHFLLLAIFIFIALGFCFFVFLLFLSFFLVCM